MQWVDLSKSPYATADPGSASGWRCLYGQMSVGEPDCLPEGHALLRYDSERCAGRKYNSSVNTPGAENAACDHECHEDKGWKCDCVSQADAEAGLSLVSAHDHTL